MRVFRIGSIMEGFSDNIKGLLKNWKTVPNLLSALRIIMVPIMAVLFVKGYPLWAVFVLFLSGLSILSSLQDTGGRGDRS